MLLSFADFPTFKEMVLSYKKVGLLSTCLYLCFPSYTYTNRHLPNLMPLARSHLTHLFPSIVSKFTQKMKMMKDSNNICHQGEVLAVVLVPAGVMQCLVFWQKLRKVRRRNQMIELGTVSSSIKPFKKPPLCCI